MWIRSTKAFNTHWTREVEIWFESTKYQILKAQATKALGTSLLIIPAELRVLVLTRRHVGSGNEINVILTKYIQNNIKEKITAVLSCGSCKRYFLTHARSNSKRCIVTVAFLYHTSGATAHVHDMLGFYYKKEHSMLACDRI